MKNYFILCWHFVRARLCETFNNPMWRWWGGWEIEKVTKWLQKVSLCYKKTCLLVGRSFILCSSQLLILTLGDFSKVHKEVNCNLFGRVRVNQFPINQNFKLGLDGSLDHPQDAVVDFTENLDFGVVSNLLICSARIDSQVIVFIVIKSVIILVAHVVHFCFLLFFFFCGYIIPQFFLLVNTFFQFFLFFFRVLSSL